MKKVVSLLLIFIMVLSILLPVLSIAARTTEEKAEELFNKGSGFFGGIKDLDENEIKSFVTKDELSSLLYDFFVLEVNKREDLAPKIGDGKQLKTYIDELITDENISILLRELKSGKAVKSLPVIEKFINNVEGLFAENWDIIVDDNIKESARSVIANFGESIETTVESQFKDIEKHWAKDEIQAIIAMGIVNGYPDGTFRPNNKISRAEFSKMIVTALQLKSTDYVGGFSDVKMGEWYANNIATMVKNEFALGYPDGTFAPNGNITRNEISIILSKVLKLEVSEEEKILLINFKDMELIPDWTKPSVAEVVKAELMKGDTDYNFNPSNNATRAEAATVIYRLTKVYKKPCNT